MKILHIKQLITNGAAIMQAPKTHPEFEIQQSTMLIQEKSSTQTLYGTDYNLWILETIKQLKNQEFESVDWSNLIDEVVDLSKRNKKKLKSLLIKLFKHLLKLKYWSNELQFSKGNWLGEIRTFRQQINDEIESSPSLKPYLAQIFLECYQKGRAIAADRSQIPLSHFPESAIAHPDQILDENWFP